VHGPELYLAGFAAALLISAVASPAGVSGAVLLLPFQESVLGTPSPAVTPTNLLYNVIAAPGKLCPAGETPLGRAPSGQPRMDHKNPLPPPFSPIPPEDEYLLDELTALALVPYEAQPWPGPPNVDLD
jgi:hypothetical protein